ncbi:phosphatase PAP2 family protein [Paenibacillus pinistramenti]|uniref:phosphatase PAP2 family protein n=1 Tax=Paenibacillus pinistramenti TaxID=1768003 RepID=UPI001396AFC2|nr:phosphatase PAP2 family protein [Paenibacillus pinistramenti]
MRIGLKEPKRWLPLGLMLIFPLLGYMYHFVDHPTRHVHSLVTSFDRATPFIKYFALPYGVWIFYIYVCLIYFYFKDRKAYYRSIALYTVCALTCYAIYSVFQTTVPRPAVTGDDAFARLVTYIYHRDEPYNCFPSIHCFSSYMVMRMIFTSPARGRWNRVLIGTMSVTIICSTLFMKQHVILDAVSAFALVEIYRLLLLKTASWFGQQNAVRRQQMQA